MTDVLLGLSVLLFAGLVVTVVSLAREQRIPTLAVRALAAASAAGLVCMLITDWPSEVLAKFWADHSVVAGILSTVLLVGVVFLAFEDSERRHQELLDSSVTAAGLGGIVDHVVDAEIALALVSRGGPPSHRGWNDGKPLRWLRDDRNLSRRSLGGAPAPEDPRSEASILPEVADPAWRADLIDQSVRRLLAGMRDWTPMIRGSRNGVLVLIALAEIRKDLMELVRDVELGARRAEEQLTLLRQRLRLLAHFLEVTSGAMEPRPEVLLTMDPLPLWNDHLDWATDPKDGAAAFGRAWRVRLAATLAQVNVHEEAALSSGSGDDSVEAVDLGRDPSSVDRQGTSIGEARRDGRRSPLPTEEG